MQSEEQSIRELVAEWQSATAAGDLGRILPLLAEDVVFLIAGSPPMRGREAFATAFKMGLQHIRIEPSATIQEIQVAGNFAYSCTHLRVTMTPLQGGTPMRRSGYTLTLFRKEPDGRWVLFRDANMVTAEAPIN
jgi:uncharacterized protein (TIGR02246 family)